MPIYEYHCDECGTDFERLVNKRDEAVACECGSGKVSRRWSVFAAHTNGGGSSKKSSDAPACSSCCAGGMCGLS